MSNLAYCVCVAALALQASDYIGPAVLSTLCQAKGTVLALNIEEVGHNCWVLEVYLLGI